MATVDPDGHQVHSSQHGEVLRDLGLAETRTIDEVADRGLAVAEGVEQLATADLSDRIEGVGCRRRSGHAGIIYRYRNM